ncbi:MAG: putative house-cleaning noncanonical NTP pyrophosphatase (MazG superfamily) [Candidatus Azotimanducaceae bacterium]|jgi:predicted house-cleaning noncanonical NTP pyrophosphatase (MazG superfamily)
MSRVYYNKLIRDGIPDKIEKKGEKYEVRELSDTQEFHQELLKKIVEESHGVAHARTREEFLDEYADLMVVLMAVEKEMELSEADIKLAIEDNVTRKGKFEQRLFLHWSEDSAYESNETPQGIKH